MITGLWLTDWLERKRNKNKAIKKVKSITVQGEVLSTIVNAPFA